MIVHVFLQYAYTTSHDKKETMPNGCVCTLYMSDHNKIKTCDKESSKLTKVTERSREASWAVTEVPAIVGVAASLRARAVVLTLHGRTVDGLTTRFKEARRRLVFALVRPRFVALTHVLWNKFTSQYKRTCCHIIYANNKLTPVFNVTQIK